LFVLIGFGFCSHCFLLHIYIPFSGCAIYFIPSLLVSELEFKMQRIGRPPKCFVREFGDQIESRVMLRDPNHNEFEIHVAKKSRELFFDDGWFTLKDVYDLWFGGWVTFAYVNPKLLTIRLTTRCGTEVEYPSHNPPLRYLLPTIESPLQAPSSSQSVSQHCFVRSFTKEMTFYDIYSGTLVFINLSLFTFIALIFPLYKILIFFCIVFFNCADFTLVWIWRTCL
jgi:hypothetical protein